MASVPASAHHSFPATYLVDQQVKIEGTMVQFLFRNPHSFVHVMAPDKNGVMQRWAVEWGPPSMRAGPPVRVATPPFRCCAGRSLSSRTGC
jgi:hypothetical protein